MRDASRSSLAWKIDRKYCI